MKIEVTNPYDRMKIERPKTLLDQWNQKEPEQNLQSKQEDEEVMEEVEIKKVEVPHSKSKSWFRCKTINTYA